MMNENESLRLTFRFEGDRINLQSAQRLHMRAPANDRRWSKGIPANVTGQWIEIRGREGESLYRRYIDSIIPQDIEVRTGDPAQPLQRINRRPKKGTIDLVVPYIEGSRVLLLLEQTAVEGTGRGAETRVYERAAVDLEKLDFANYQ